MSHVAWKILQEKEKKKQEIKEKKIKVALRAQKLLQNGFRKLPIDFKEILRRLTSES